MAQKGSNEIDITENSKHSFGNTGAVADVEDQWSMKARELLLRGDIAPYKEVRRPMMSRVYAAVQQIILNSDGNQDLVRPGLRREGCCVCCVASENCPCLSLVPCYGEPMNIHQKRESSKYILMRENSIEWNNPIRISRPGSLCNPFLFEFCGVSCCQYDIKDDIKVVYFDDPMLDRIRYKAPCCCGLDEALYGSDGEKVRIDSACCMGLCIRGTWPLCFIPCCFPLLGISCPCSKYHDIIVQSRDRPKQHTKGGKLWRGAPEAIQLIKSNRDAALRRLAPLPLGECAAESMVKQMQANIMERQLSEEEEKSPEQVEVENNVRFLTDAMANKLGKQFYGYIPKSRTNHDASSAQNRLSAKDLQYTRTIMTRMYRPVVQIYGFHSQHEDVRMGVVKELQTSGSSIPAAPTHQSLCACCHSPANCPCCSLLPCCMLPKYISDKFDASNFILIRENSVEWNKPKIVSAKGDCCGLSLCYYDIQDNISVIYYDDPMFESVSNKTRCCNESRTVCCGGQGERVRISSTFCNGLCIRGILPCPCVPNLPCLECCPCIECCALQANIYVKPADGHWGGAEMAVDIIQKARIGGIQRLLVDEERKRSMIAKMGSRAKQNCNSKSATCTIREGPKSRI